MTDPPNPYTVRHVVGTGADLTCTSCTGCSYAATCENIVKFYTDTLCNSAGDFAAPNGACNPVTGQDPNTAKQYKSLKYTSTFLSGSYNATAPEPTRTVTGTVQTVCCKP